jgi:hypothetical protein
MSLQGPAWPRCVRSLHRRGAPLRRPCILFLAITSFSPSPAAAKCHLFAVWHYPKPQKCFTALAPRPISREIARREAGFVPERIEIILPAIDFVPCPDGDERFQGIAKLHALMDAR